jgi:hypothetical protein
MKKGSTRFIAASAAVTSALFIANCSRSSPSAPSPANAQPGSQSVVGATTTSTPELGTIKVCVTGGGSATFSVVATPVGGGSATVQNPANGSSGACIIVAEDFDGTGAGSNVTTTQTSPAFQSVTGQLVTAEGGVSSFSPTNGGVLFLNSFHGYVLTFTVSPPPPPPPSTQGCSPGYFKNHSDVPAGYNRSQTLNSVLTTNVFSATLTIDQALSLKGGGMDALARHAAAAILNAAALDGNYAYTLTQLRAIFDRIEAGTLTVEGAISLLESKEDVDGIVCPLS